MKKENNYFKLYANCIPVKGINRSLICDLQNEKLFFIPNDLFRILVKHQTLNLQEVKIKYKNEYDSIIDEYFEYLCEIDVGFYTIKPKLFPKMSMNWYYPFEISNAIIDINNSHFYKRIERITVQLELFYCKHLQIRFFKDFGLDELITFMRFLDSNGSGIISVQFIIKYSHKILEKQILDLIKKYDRVSSIIIYNYNQNKSINVRKDGSGLVLYSSQKIINEKSCGIINESMFVINSSTFTESLNHNSCLNRKISIDVDGNIKNCPSMSQSFGNIGNTTLQEALNHKDFKKYWNITKDQIDVCKDCEFRYVCTDCRAYKENPEDNYSKPLKCGYNPYTSEWEEWSTNPLKKKAIEYYGMQELVKKND